MSKLTWFLAVLAVTSATGVEAIPVGSDGVEVGLLKAIASSGLIGSFLVWYIYTGRRDLVREREESSKREVRLVERLSKLEDEMRSSLIAVLQDTRTAIQEFKSIAQRCREIHERNAP